MHVKAKDFPDCAQNLEKCCDCKKDVKLVHIVVRHVDINVGFLKRQVYIESLFVQGYYHLLVMDSMILSGNNGI